MSWTADPRIGAIVENLADGLIVTDEHGAILLFNPAAERLFGYAAGEILGRNVSLLAVGDSGWTHERAMQRYLDTRQKRIIGTGREVEGVRKDGQRFRLYISVGEVHVADFRGFVGVVHDLTAQQVIERELAGARAHLQDILDSLASMLVVLDAEGRVLHWNRAAERLWRVPPERVKGHTLDHVLPFLADHLPAIADAIARRQSFRCERLPYPAEGQRRFADVALCPLADQQLPGAVLRLDDVTERMRMEEMMVQTEKMMSVGGLAAGMAHEINNPLGIMAQSCQNLRRRLASEIPANRAIAEELDLDLERVRTYLDRRGFYRFLDGMQEAAARATRIVSDMLAFSRRSASSFVPVRLGDLLEQVIRLASHDYDLKKHYDFRRVQIRRDYGSASDEIACDRTAMEQVVLNLLKNAAQAMAETPSERVPTIVLRLRDEGDWIRLEVADNGPGMSDETRRRLFEPFYTTKPAGTGTGLGLAVAYFIVTEQHGGTMEVRDAPGGGSCFVVRLPRRGSPFAPHAHGSAPA